MANLLTNSLARALTYLLPPLAMLGLVELAGISVSHAGGSTPTGVCNVVINGYKNTIYGYVCLDNGTAKQAIFDPPTLWIGDDLAKARKALGSRNPLELRSNGGTTLSSPGALFGVQGDADYSFGSDDKLKWMSVQAQCSEEKYDFATRPPGLDPAYEKWARSEDALSFDMGEQEISCDKILTALETLKKLFGKPSMDRSKDHDEIVTMPPDNWFCDELYGGSGTHPKCGDIGKLRTTWDYEFIGADRTTGIGIEIRQVEYHGEIQFAASYFPQAHRQEIFVVLSIWGDSGRPVIEGHPYGGIRFSLQR